MTTQENKDCLKNYQFLKTIGEGTFGKVKLSLHLLTNEYVAIKILEKSRITDKDELERVEKEIKYLKLFDHPNIIQLYEVIENDYNYYIIMEYIPDGEFFNYIVEKERIEEKEASFFYSQIIHGIKEINSKSICHRDIKPENLLLTKDKTIKIIDFGLSNEYVDTLNTQCGSPCYAAPEIISGNKYNGLMVDIWASGIILFAMLFGYLPFDDKDNNILFRKILECNLEFPNDMEASNEAKDLIARILTRNPNERIKLDEILNHPFLLSGNKQYRKIIKPLRFNKSRLIVEYMVNVLNYSNKDNCIFKAVNENKHNGITTTFKLLKKQLLENRFNFKLLEEKTRHIKPYTSPIKYIHVKPNNFNIKKNPINTNINIINNKIKERANLIKCLKEKKDNNKIIKAHSADNTITISSKNLKHKNIKKKKINNNDNSDNENVRKIYLNYLLEKKWKLKPLLDKLNIKKINNINFKKKIDTSVSVDKKKTKSKNNQRKIITKTPPKIYANPFRIEYEPTYKYNYQNKKIIYIPSNLTNKLRGKSDAKANNNNIKNKQIQIQTHRINNKIRQALTPINQHRYIKYRGLSADIPNKMKNKFYKNDLRINRLNRNNRNKYLACFNTGNINNCEKNHNHIKLKTERNRNINAKKENNHHFKTISDIENKNKRENIIKTPKPQIKQNIIFNKYNTLQNSPNEKKNQLIINANIIYNWQITNSNNKYDPNKKRKNHIIKTIRNIHKEEYKPLNMRNKNPIKELKDLSIYSEKKRTVSTMDGSSIIYPKKEIRKLYIRNDNINPKMKNNNISSKK